jgi:pilus assembly protein CpaB
MRPKSLMLLLLALGCGLVASIGISQVIESRNRAAQPTMEKEPIYVAMQDIKVNQPLTPQIVTQEEWPKEKIPADAIRDIKEIQGQRSGTTILAGEPLRKAKFAMDKRIDEIPSGYRVVAVPADAVSAAGYLLQPGDRVDVLMYVDATNAKSGVQQSLTKTILQDVRIFAVNEQWRPAEDKSNESITAKTVSLLVTPEQAEKMMQATEMGKIRLVLRNPDDPQVAETNGTDAAELLTGVSSGDRTKEWGVKKKPAGEGNAKEQPPENNQEHFVMHMVRGGELVQVDMTRNGEGTIWTPSEPRILVPADPTPSSSQTTTVNPPSPTPPPAPVAPMPVSLTK